MTYLSMRQKLDPHQKETRSHWYVGHATVRPIHQWNESLCSTAQE
uniref:Uncharacterized protein n=1 Tax=Setaria italica TaxID=4555 RepID=A0A0Q3NUD9_SETIT